MNPSPTAVLVTYEPESVKGCEVKVLLSEEALRTETSSGGWNLVASVHDGTGYFRFLVARPRATAKAVRQVQKNALEAAYLAGANMVRMLVKNKTQSEPGAIVSEAEAYATAHLADFDR